MTYYKAVDKDGVSFFPLQRSKRVNWVEKIGTTYELGDDEAWTKAVEALRDGDTVCCTEHLIHGYADVDLAIDFGQRHGKDKGFRIIEFDGTPVAQLEGALVLERIEFKGKTLQESQDAKATYVERFPNPVKYGFRRVEVLREYRSMFDLPTEAS